MEKRRKKAQGHIEIILSFVIFVGFLLFLFAFMNPFAKTKPVYIMDDIEKAIIKNISAEIGKLSVIVKETGDCYDISKIVTYKKTEEKIRVVKDIENPRKYIVYYGTDFIEDNPACNYNINYDLGIYSRETIVIHEKIAKLKTDYASDYNNLKSWWGITNDFMFSVEDLDGNQIPELSVDKKIPKTINVESKGIPIRTINTSGQIKELILNIKVW